MSTPAAASKSKTPYTKGNLYQIPCTDLQADPNQPRKYFDEVALDELANSITTHGILQPVLFREDMDGKLIIVAGERRLKATTKAGLKTIPAILSDGNPDEVALVENIIREDLTAIDHAEAVNRLMEVHSYTQEQVGIFMRKAKSTVSEILSLNNLPDKIKNECRKNPKISRKTLITIAKKKKPGRMMNAYEKYKENAAKALKRGRPKGKVQSFVERFTTKHAALTAFVAEKDFGTLDTPERQDLIYQIEELKRAADSLIEKIQAAPVKEATPVKAPKMKKEKVVKVRVVKEKKPVAKKLGKRPPVGAKSGTKK